MEIRNIAEKALAQSQKAGADKTLVSVSSTEAQEFNIEANKLTLLRTTFDQGLEIKTILDQRQSSTNGNQFSDEAVGSMVHQALASTKASPQDPGNGFAPSQGKKDFSFGGSPINEEWMHSCLTQLLKEREEKFSQIIIDGGTIKFVKSQKVLCTSEGTLLTSQQGHYEGFVMFTSKKGGKTSSFNYIDFIIAADQGGKPLSLLETANLKELMRQSAEQTTTRKIPAKFEGEMIITPPCLHDFIVGGWNSYLGSARMLKKSSFFENKMGQTVASPKWTLTAQPADSNFAARKFWTSDGYIAQNEVLFEKGILQNYLLNHYAAAKLNQKASRSEGSFLKLAPGDKKLQDMISQVKKGVLLSRFSAGNPSENGDISGVAKNSYYIENGEIQFPLGETMISANLSRLLYDVQDISLESVNNGHWELPWVRLGGVTVS